MDKCYLYFGEIRVRRCADVQITDVQITNVQISDYRCANMQIPRMLLTLKFFHLHICIFAHPHILSHLHI
jgi:hypothetical protein